MPSVVPEPNAEWIQKPKSDITGECLDLDAVANWGIDS